MVDFFLVYFCALKVKNRDENNTENIWFYGKAEISEKRRNKSGKRDILGFLIIIPFSLRTLRPSFKTAHHPIVKS